MKYPKAMKNMYCLRTNATLMRGNAAGCLVKAQGKQ